MNFAFPGPPDPPVNITTTSDDCCVNLNWYEPPFDGGSKIIGFKIYRKKGYSDYKSIAEIGNDTFYSDIGLINGETYYYKISAVNYIGEGTKSEMVIGIPKTEPMSPENVKAKSGKGFINLSWSEPGNNGGTNVTGYTIYRGIEKDREKLFITVNGTNTSYNDTTVVNGIRYYYYINAINEMGESFVNDKINLIPLGVPNRPVDVKAWVFKGYIKLTWRSPLDDGGREIVFFNLYKGTNRENVSLLTKVERKELIFEDKNLVDGRNYYYFITAENEFGESGPSTTVNGTAVVPETEEEENNYSFMIVMILAIIIIGIGLFVIKRKRDQKQELKHVADYTSSVNVQSQSMYQPPGQFQPQTQPQPTFQEPMSIMPVQVQQYQPNQYNTNTYPEMQPQQQPQQQSQPLAPVQQQGYPRYDQRNIQFKPPQNYQQNLQYQQTPQQPQYTRYPQQYDRSKKREYY
jgi:hypothetical protein